jgi:hypothetical protein
MVVKGQWGTKEVGRGLLLPLALSMFGSRADHTHNAVAADDAAFLANTADRRANFHGECLGWWWRVGGEIKSRARRRGGRGIEFRNGLIGAEAIYDTSLLKVIGSHLKTYSVAREDPDTVQAHAAGEVTEECMIFCLLRKNADAEGGVGEALFNNADELNHGLAHSLRKRGGGGNPSWLQSHKS